MADSKNSHIRVLVTGASGFISSHVIQLLLKNGYMVRGSVRNLSNQAKIRHLKELCPEAQTNLELVEADLMNVESWIKAVDGCKFVIHVASPFPSIDPADPDDLYIPAVEGTLAVLKAAHAAGCVKRVVLTSSGAAIVGEGSKDGKPINEDHWTNMEDNVNAYMKSKMLAEKAAWTFVKEHPTLELAVINPGYVMGPVLHGSDCTSSEVVIRMFNWQMIMVPDIWYSGVDVRDVAEAHYKAIILPEAAGIVLNFSPIHAVQKSISGKRFSVGTRLISFLEIAQILKEEFAPQGYWISAMPAPYWAVWIYSFLDKGARMTLRDIGRKYYLDNGRMRTILGMDQPIDVKKSVIDMAYSVIEKGFVKKTSKYKGPQQWATQCDKHKQQ